VAETSTNFKMRKHDTQPQRKRVLKIGPLAAKQKQRAIYALDKNSEDTRQIAWGGGYNDKKKWKKGSVTSLGKVAQISRPDK